MQLSENALTLLAVVNDVDMNTATATTLYTVPVGYSCIVTHVVVRNPDSSLDTASYSFGWNSPSFNDVITGATHAELNATSKYVVLSAKAGAVVGDAGDAFKVIMNILQGAAATTHMEVFGYLY